MGGGGGSPQPTNTTTQTSNIPEYARPYVETMLGATQQQLFNTQQKQTGTDESGNPIYSTDITGVKPYVPYSANPEDYVAGFSPLQQQAQQGVANLQMPGEYGAAAGLTGAATMGSMGAGRDYQRMATSPYAMGAYMNPYLSQSLAPQLAEIQRQSDITGLGLRGQSVAQGAFGGNRAALQQAENQRNALMAKQQAIGQGYNQAYNQAQQAMQYGAGLGLQGQQAAMQGAGQLANIGGAGLQAQQGILGLQAQTGAQQQAQQQNIINQAIQNYATAQQYPQQQLAFMNSMIRGLPLQTMTTQGYQAAPSTFSQLGGLAATGLGAYGAMGGFKGAKGGLPKDFEKVKRFDVGGAVNYDLEQLAETDEGVAKLVEISRTSPSAMIRRRASQILADHQPKPGIASAPSNLPVMTAADGGIMSTDGDDGYAGGGMIAFERGGIAALPVKHYVDTGLVFEDPYGGEPYGKTATRTPTMGTKEVLENLERGKKAQAAAEAAKKVKDAADVAKKGIDAVPKASLAGTGRFLSPLASAPALAVSTIGEKLADATRGTMTNNPYFENYSDPFMGDIAVGNAILNQNEGAKQLALKEGEKADKKAPAAAPAAPTPAPAAKKEKDGIEKLIDEASGTSAGGIDAMFGNTPLGRLQAEAYKKVQEADLKQSKAQADLDKQREEIAANKDQKLWQAIMMGGAKTMAGTSPRALANIGEGISGGLSDYAKAEQAERAEKKLLLQYQTALDQADYAKKMGNFTALEQIQGRLAGLKIAAMNAKSNKETALEAAYQKNFVTQVGEAMYKYGMTEDQAIAHVKRSYLAADRNAPEGVTVTKVSK